MSLAAKFLFTKGRLMLLRSMGSQMQITLI
jgi:hypothetical protein